MDDTLAVVHIVFVTLPVLETDTVGLIVAEVHPELVPEEEVLRVFVTVKELVWHALSDEVVVTDVEKDEVKVPDPLLLVVTLRIEESEPDTVGESVPLRVEEDVWDTEVLKHPDTVEDKHSVGEALTEVVVDEDPVMVPEVQGEGVILEEEQCEEETELDKETLTVPLKVGLVE